MHTINANAVRGHSYEIFFHKIHHTKVSLHENFQIYDICDICRLCHSVLSIPKPVFANFDRFIVLTNPSGAYGCRDLAISVVTTTDRLLYPCTRARSNNTSISIQLQNKIFTECIDFLPMSMIELSLSNIKWCKTLRCINSQNTQIYYLKGWRSRQPDARMQRRGTQG